MMPIAFSEAELSADEKIKQSAATKQMQDLLTLLSKGTKYATLTVADRQMLLKKGFAKDLVDNVVFFTERFSNDLKSNALDSLVLGYTHAAFDSSVFACESILSSLMTSHAGRCAYCESQISHTGSGCVSHFRPAWGTIVDGHWQRDAYYHLAYDQRNLLFSCQSCHEYYKGSQFPVRESKRVVSNTDIETPLLVNPYDDDPRDFIRFNPLSGEAYAYDQFRDYCVDKLAMDVSAIDEYIWSNPDQLPSDLLSFNAGDYTQWFAAKPDRNPTKGQVTIDTLGLNRPDLVRARVISLQGLHGLYLAHYDTPVDSQGDPQIRVDALLSLQSSHGSYHSSSIDAMQSWVRRKDGDRDTWLTLYQSVLDNLAAGNLIKISPSFSSSLHYMVLESELNLSGKRRIVSLHGSDFLYGSDRKVKTVFLPIDWENDFGNVIKVSCPDVIWEASFSELSETQPVALQSLFANNEVWAEGNYCSLA